MNLSVLVLNYNDALTTISYINRIKRFKVIDKILIVDNCSTDDSFNQLMNVVSNKVELIRTKKNGGYGYGNNYGVKYLIDKYDSKYILISNPDVIYDEIILTKMLNQFKKNNNIAVVAPFMKDINGLKELGTAWKIPSKLQYTLSADLIIGKKFSLNKYIDLEKRQDEFVFVDCVAGSLLMVDSQKMKDFGMYDEKVFLYGEETILGIKLKNNNQRTVLLLNDSFIHYHGVSIKKTIKSDIERRKLILKSRLYILEKYMKASKIFLLFARIFFKISIFEYSILLKIRNKWR